MLLTLGWPPYGRAIVRLLPRGLPYVQPVGAWLMTVAEEYLYWLTPGDPGGLLQPRVKMSVIGCRDWRFSRLSVLP